MEPLMITPVILEFSWVILLYWNGKYSNYFLLGA